MNVATARLFLAQVAARQVTAWPAALDESAVPALARWLTKQELGPLAFACCRDGDGAAARLATCLHEDYHKAMAEAAVQQSLLAEIRKRFAAAALPVVLLKGVAVQPLYGRPGLRTMSDIDFWVPPARMAEAVALLEDAGFYVATKAERPPALQQMSQGEVQLFKEGWPHWLTELHWSPFAGWWLQRTAAIDNDALWSRRVSWPESAEAEGVARLVYQLAPEDAIIHLAVHLAVNHQFAPPVVRSLMDIVLSARARPVDWNVVAARARAWRLATATWLALDLAGRLVGLEGAAVALDKLQPGRVRLRLLRRFVSPQWVLAGRDLRHGRWRFLLLLLLVDRPLDAGKLVLRAVWPEPEWLAARYGDRASRRRHLWGILARGQV
jgi:hypothetical protein